MQASRLTQAAPHRLAGPALLVAFVATMGFVLIAIAVTSHAGILRYDLAWARWLHAHPQPAVIASMRLVSWMNGVAGIGVMAAALALWLWRVHARTWLEILLLAIPGVMLSNALLKQMFSRPRPCFIDAWTSVASYSFPSGHVSQSTVFYGLLATLLWVHSCSRIIRALIIVVASLMVFAVAASRLYLGAHYLSDVLAAFCEGVVWLALCQLAVAWRHRLNDGVGGE